MGYYSAGTWWIMKWVEIQDLIDEMAQEQEEKCIIVQTHYELECSCKPDAIEVCKLCKQLLQSMYPEIPFEGDGL